MHKELREISIYCQQNNINWKQLNSIDSVFINTDIWLRKKKKRLLFLDLWIQGIGMYIYRSFRFSIANTNNINRENVAVEPSALIAAWQTDLTDKTGTWGFW